MIEKYQWLSQVRALADMLRDASETGYAVYTFPDRRRNIFEADLWAGVVRRIQEAKGSRPSVVRNPDVTNYKTGYHTTRLYLTAEANGNHARPHTHIILKLLGDLNRTEYKESALRAITEGDSTDRIKHSINHSDFNRTNNRSYNLAWYTSLEQAAHKLAGIVRASRGAEVLPVPYNTAIANALRAEGEYRGKGGLCLAAGVNILSDLYPDLYGDFYAADGVNNTMLKGKPAAAVYSDMISAAKLPADSTMMAVLKKDLTCAHIRTGSRAPWWVLNDMHSVGAVAVLGEVGQIK